MLLSGLCGLGLWRDVANLASLVMDNIIKNSSTLVSIFVMEFVMKTVMRFATKNSFPFDL